MSIDLPYNVVSYDSIFFDNISGAFLYYNFITKNRTFSQVEREATDNDIIFMSYPEEFFDELYNKKIMLIGFNGNIQLFKKIVRVAKEILMFDNNNKVKEMYEQINVNKQKIKLIFNNKSSVSSLVWNFFYPDEPLPIYIKYLNDLYSGDKTTMTASYFYSGIRMRPEYFMQSEYKLTEANSPKFFDKWTKLFDPEYVDRIVAVGENYIRFATTIVRVKADDIVTKYFPSEKIYKKYNNIFMGVNQYKVMVCNWIDEKLVSYVRGGFNKKHGDCDLIMLWDYKVGSNFYRIQLISTRKQHINLHKIAAIFDKPDETIRDAISFKINKSEYEIDELFS